MNKKWKERFIALAKWTFAIGILTLLLKSGKISLNDLGVFLKQPSRALLCVLIIFGNYLISFYRWRTMVGGLSLKLKYTAAVRLGMLGQFFSSVIPGTVGGDLVKAVYVAKRFPEKKVAAVSTIFLDRVVGLLGMVLLSGTAYFFGRHLVAAGNGNLIHLIQALGTTLMLGAITIVVFFLALTIWGSKFPNHLPKKYSESFWYKKVEPLYEIIVAYKKRPMILWRVLLLSVFIHIVNMACFWIIANTIYGPSPWGSVSVSTFVLSGILGLIAMAIPVAPMGLGVGQVAFSAIFLALGAPSAAFGTSIVTVQQLVSLCVNLSGAVFFATYKQEIPQPSLV